MTQWASFGLNRWYHAADTEMEMQQDQTTPAKLPVTGEALARNKNSPPR